jgi:hypothetical protein
MPTPPLRLAFTLPAVLLAGCAVVDPHIPVGPEAGYCYASSRTAAAGGSLFDGCPTGSVRHVAWAGERTPGLHLDESLALLRDRRRRMAEREAELARIDAGTTVAAFAGALAAAGGAILGAANNFVAWTGFAAAGSLATNQAFATQGMRDVYNAGVVALSCVEARALSARLPAGARLDTSALSALSTSRLNLAAALARAEAVTQPTDPPGVTNDFRAAITAGRAALAQIDTTLAAAAGGPLSGPQIAVAVYDRTLAITSQVNREIDRATPSAETVLALARAVGAPTLDAKADTAGASADAAKTAGESAGRAESEPAMAAARAATGGDGVTALNDLRRTANAAADNANRFAATLRASPGASLAEIRACAYDQALGEGMTLSGNALTLAAGSSSGTVAVTGGRPPYRISATGQNPAGITASPEYSPGAFAVSRGAGRRGTATFLIQDQGDQRQVVTVTAE